MIDVSLYKNLKLYTFVIFIHNNEIQLMFYKILMKNSKLKQIIEPFKAIYRTANDLSHSIDRRSSWPRK